MLKTLETLYRAALGRAEDRLIDQNAVLLLDQKLREAEEGHAAAKRTLAALVLQERQAERNRSGLDARIADLEMRTGVALRQGKDALANDGAEAIAALTNERNGLDTLIASLELKGERLRLAIERAERRIVDIRQGLYAARASEKAARATHGLRGTTASLGAIREAEDLLKRLGRRDDSIEELDILDGIEAGLKRDDIVERMAEAGIGTSAKIRPGDVLDRLRTAL